jgi:hypothetical protein
VNDSEYPPDAPIPHNVHRVLWIITWTLFALGLLEWFILGANRPLDPVVSGSALGAASLALRHVAG